MISSDEQLINCNDQASCFNIELHQNHSSEIIQMSESSVARIFNIQRYSLNDGNGIRTVVFFKGCPHHCPWCANPESISRQSVVVKRKSKCIKCKFCCNDADECPSKALEKIGYDIQIDELINQILKDEIFFRTSGGGVTLSGGEVLLQAKFAYQLLKRLKQLGINTAIETAGDIRFSDFLSVASQCDEVLFDFKIMDQEKAMKTINLHLDRVLNNFRQLYHHNINLIPRLPLIPQYTLFENNVMKILSFLKEFNRIKVIHILPFHKFGESKYELIHQNYEMKDIAEPSPKEIDEIKKLIENHGYRVVNGG
ncbi:[formate-C-acetyltransferase]-activating enzyme [Gilliamella apicola]|uniref:[formate-C-acetyltransferase]-activating enzyme n=1 Tax=Gilliamella apicola TaxID=1196095 RepID=A0A2V4DYK8_9GAMM|nr:[formate-C-acetyltransferase]-activating enzyme [Gilliamella apicola]PXZ05960.1 [formate-C-acetyltransferase]-activating enzyme [Gilliamella apicola]